MFAHDILRASLTTPSFSPAPADRDKQHYHHQQQRAAFSPSSTASTIARAADGFGRGVNLLGTFDSTTGDYSPPPASSHSFDAWAGGSAHLRGSETFAASALDDDDGGSARGGRDQALVAKVQQLQDDNSAMLQTIRTLQAQLAKRPKSPSKAADKSALLPRMIKDR